MATLAERIATLAAELAALERSHARLDQQVNGGSDVVYSESIRGKLHKMQSALAAVDKLTEATKAAASAQREAAHTVEVARGRMLNRWLQIVLAVCAVATAAAAWAALLHHAG